MKKLLLLSAMSLLLGACANESNTEDNNSDEVASEAFSGEINGMARIESDMEEAKESEDGILETETYTLEFLDSEVIQSSMEQGKGLYLTYKITNNSETNIVPHDIVEIYTTVEQTTDTSVVELQKNYHALDAFGEENYNNMVEKSNESGNELLPGKTVEVSEAVYLEREDLPIEITAHEVDDFTPVIYFETDI